MRERVTESQFNAFLKGDQQVFAMLIVAETRKLYAYIDQMLKSRLETEEVGQDVFLELWNDRGKMSSVEDFYRFMYAKAKFKALNRLRQKIPTSVELSDNLLHIDDLQPDVESLYEAAELMLRVESIVETMPAQRQKIAKMSYFEGLKQKEIAEQLNISPVTVSRHLSDAMDQLRRMLKIIALLITLFQK